MCPHLAEEQLWADETTRCEICPVSQLERSYGSEKGQRIQIAQEIVNAQIAGFSINWDALESDLALAVLLFKSERERFNRESEDPNGN